MTETSFLTVAQPTSPESVSLGWDWYVRAIFCLEALSLFFFFVLSFFDVDHFKSLSAFVTILFLFYVLAF